MHHYCHAWFLPAGSINRTTNKTARTCMQRTRAHMYYVCTYPPNNGTDLHSHEHKQIIANTTDATDPISSFCVWRLMRSGIYHVRVVARVRPPSPTYLRMQHHVRDTCDDDAFCMHACSSVPVLAGHVFPQGNQKGMDYGGETFF